ncbi:MAG: PIN domain-containing protein [Burkholderiaceae bacterium]|nr:PIN domain-containing protein [Burkholderiaceae bacterium]
MRVFLDANILFSAAKSDGAVRALVRWLLDHGHECQVDTYVAAEARRNLVNKGPQAVQVLDALLGRLQGAPTPASAVGAGELDWLPAKDRSVLAAAICVGCDALVTGDRTHFGSAYGRRVGGVTIDSPRSLAETVLTQ